MRHIKVIVAMVAVVATMMVLAAPAMAQSFDSPSGFILSPEGIILLSDEDLEDLEEEDLDEGVFLGPDFVDIAGVPADVRFVEGCCSDRISFR